MNVPSDGGPTEPRSVEQQTAIVALPPRKAFPSKLALNDLVSGLQRWALWVAMGWQDIKTRYRRSTLGPFWLTMSMGITVGAMGTLYAGLFKLSLADYLPHLTLGLLFWALIANTLTEGCQTFIASEGFIKQIRIPFTAHVLRVVWRNYIIFLHNLVVYLPVAVLYRVEPGWVGLLTIPGLVLIALNAVWAVLLLGMVCVRFRDIPQIVGSLLQVAFFVTPIIWHPSALTGRLLFVVRFNPFYHFLEIVRAPLMGQMPALESWVAAGLVTVVGWAFTAWFFTRFRARIPYWV
jgi:homopolymeric O-antigen transport system permease protein